MESELTRLSILGWKIPEKDEAGIKSKKLIETTNSIKLSENTLGLPKFRDLETKDIERIAKIIR